MCDSGARGREGDRCASHQPLTASWGPHHAAHCRAPGPLAVPLLMARLPLPSPPLPSPPQPPPPLLFPYGQDCTQKWQQVISTWAQSEVWQCGLNPQQGGAGPGTGNLSRIQAAASVRAPGQGRRDHLAAPGRQCGTGWGSPRKNPLTSLSVSSLTPSRPTPTMQVLRGPFHR